MAKLTRSQQMARIRGRDTSPELLLRRLLWARGMRYRVHFRTPAGRADLTFVGKRVAVFVDGCFWHGCPEHYVTPRSSREFWATKLRANVQRDQRQTEVLECAGWTVLRFWEHEVGEDPEAVASCIARCLDGRAASRGGQPRVVAVDFVDDVGKVERRHLQTLSPVRELGSVVRERSTSKWDRGAKRTDPARRRR
ncbi:MAG: very short patch repair endonuclease [Planctomycetes bacterium]|nr:very short patch repair endonuclease [Planctomycetota bacterium]